MKKALYVALGLVLALGLVISLAGCGAGPGSNLPSGGRMVALDVAEPAPPAQPTSYTEKTDYEPGDTVAFIGSGFQPGETVNIEAVGAPWGTALTATLTADDSGAISGQLTLPEAFEDTYTLTATGAISGLVGQTSFTDSSGAIWTTDSTCERVNENLYPSKDAVYLSGGPAKPGQNGLPDGAYYVQVTEPEGSRSLLGSTPTASVQVTNGEFTQCYQLWAILRKASDGTQQGYDDTTNPGGEYKVWVSKNSDFPNSESKTDNFKVEVTLPPLHGTATITTNVYDADDTYIPPDGDVPLGTIVYDTATVTGEAGKPAPTGNVTFNLYKGTNNSGTLIYSSPDVPLGTPSNNSPALHAGDYVFQATYNGDNVYDPVTSGHEHFVVDKADVTMVTEIHDADHNPVTEVPLASIVHDQATVTGIDVSGFEPAGTVAFTFDGNAAGSSSISGEDPAVVESDNEGPLHAGDYTFSASYTDTGGDYNDKTSANEPLTVDKGDVTIVTEIHDADHNVVTEVPLASIVHDQATVTGIDVSGFEPAGTVDFTFNGSAAGSEAISSEDPAVVESDNEGPLHAGDYTFAASYTDSSGDYNNATSRDEPLNVKKADVTIVTTIYTKSGAEVTGQYPIASTTVIYDKATVKGIGVPGFEPAGTVAFTYDSTSAGSFFISGDPVTVQSNDVGPLAAGSYAFKATYTDASGDYNNRTSDLEPFSVVKVEKGKNGKTLGFWSNKNGQSYINGTDLAMLVALNLVDAKGADFNPTSYTTFRNWLLRADAVYMGYMLSAQLSATELTVYNGLQDGTQRVWLDDGDGIIEPGETPTINDIMNSADSLTKSPNRALQEYYKNLLDKFNNNLLWLIFP